MASTMISAVAFKDGIYKAILINEDESQNVVMYRPYYINDGFQQSKILDDGNVTVTWSCHKSDDYKKRVRVICNRFNKIVEEMDVLDLGA